MKVSKLVFTLAIAATAISLGVSNISAQPSTLRTDAWIANGPVNAIVHTNGITYIGGEFTAVLMATGNGALLSRRTAWPFPLPRVNGAINAVVSDGAGGWYVGGEFATVDNSARLRLAHILANGTLDSAWKPEVTGGGTPRVLALALHGATLYVGGEFTNISGETRNNLAALYAATGQVVTTWNPNVTGGNVTIGSVRALAVEGPLIYAGGSFKQVGSGINAAKNLIAAIDSTAGEAKNWNPNLTGEVVNTIVVSGTTVYIGGIFTKVGTQTRNHIAAVNSANGNPLPWDPNASGGASTSVQALAVSGSRVYAGGTFTSIGAGSPQTPQANVAAIDVATGKAVMGWTPDVNDQVNALAVHGSTVYLGGKFTRIGSSGSSGNPPQSKIAAIDTNGVVLDWKPDLGSAAATTFISALAISGSTVYAGGNFSINVTFPRNRLAAFEASTGRPTTWNPDVIGSAVRVLAVSASRMYVGGVFTSVGGVARNNLAALDLSTGALIKAWNPNPNGEIRAIDVAGPTVYVGGSFSSIGVSERPSRANMNVAALDSTIGNPAEWNPLNSFSRPSSNIPPFVSALKARGEFLYLGGNFTLIGGSVRNFLAALDVRNGEVVENWNPEISNGDSVRALVISGSTIYAGGKFAAVKGKPRNSIVAIDAVSGIPTDWDPNVQTIPVSGNPTAGVVRSITIHGSAVYLGGTFNNVGGVMTRNNAAAVNIDDMSIQAWNPNVGAAAGTTAAVNAIEVSESNIFLGGNFTSIAGLSQNNFAPLGETPQNPVPSLFSINPTVGKRLQTLNVTFKGKSFVDDFISVNVGDGIAVNSIKFTNSTALTANITITESAAPGTRNFSVTNNPPGGGTSSVVPFTITNPAPIAAGLKPASGRQAQSLDVEITGSKFISGVTTANFGPDITVNTVTVTSATRMTANITISASAALGKRDVNVFSASPGGGTATLSRAFAVNYAIPTLISISPASGDRLQTLDVVFTGSGFVKSVTTLINVPGITVNSITVNSPTSLIANLTITAQAATGKHNFSVTNGGPDGTSENQIFTVNNPSPNLEAIAPADAGRGQTHDILLKGTNFFAGASTVSFGPDISVNLVTVNSDTQITANITIPIGVEVGDRTVSVINAAPGGGTAALPNGFFVNNPRPELLSITPTIGSLNQSLEVELNGAYFIEGVTNVDFGEGILLHGATVVSSTQIIANITIEDSAPQGGRDIFVANDWPGGGSAALPNGFTVTSGAVVHFSVPTDLRGSSGEIVEIPLNLDPANRRVGSFDAKLSYDPQMLTYVGFAAGAILYDDWQSDANAVSGAVKVGAYMRSTPITEAGTAIILRFRVQNAAALGATVPLGLSNLTATDGNAKALPTDGANGLFTVGSEAKISGRLFYFTNSKPLTDVNVQLQVADPERAEARVSDENGSFEFKALPLGSNIILTPRRVVSDFAAAAIKSGDAFQAFKGRENGPEPLTGYRILAADVNGDCQITSGDALAILKRSTGSFENFRRFVPEDWRFVDASFDLTAENWCAAPPSRFYEPFADGQSGQDFVGILLGDVNGSFGGAVDKIAAAHPGHAPVVAISAPPLVAGSAQLNFVVEVSAADNGYNSFDLSLTFDAAIRVTNVALGNMLKVEDWQTDWNAKQPGVLRIAAFSMTEDCIKGHGRLVVIQAELAQPVKEGEALNLEVSSASFGIDGEEIPVSTEAGSLQIVASLPLQYALEQNYPNPFLRETGLSTTMIQYALPEASMVYLRIYDVLGNVVRTLVSKSQDAGNHTAIWNGQRDDGAPAGNGVYFYRLEAGRFAKTHKLILQK